MMNLSYTTPSVPLSWLNSSAQLVKGTQYVSIESNPNIITASENITRYNFNYATTGNTVKTKLTLVVGLAGVPSVTAGSITLKNSFMTLVLTASNTPNTNQFYNNGIGTTPLDRAARGESIAFELRSNVTFNQYYNVWAQGASVFIEARVEGEKYNFDLAVLSANLILLGGIYYNNINGTNLYNYQSLIDYSTFVEVYVTDGIYGDVLSRRESYLADVFNIIPYNTPSFAINISDTIKNYTGIVLPTKNLNNIIQAKELDKQFDINGYQIPPVVRPYFITWGYEHRFGIGLEKKKFLTGQSRIRYTLNGAFGLLEEYDFTPYVLDTTNTAAVKFMSSCPLEKDTDYNSHEYIHFYRRANSAYLGVMGIQSTFTFYDGTSVTTSSIIPSDSVTGTLSIDISPNTLSIATIEAINAKKVDYYTVNVYWTIGSTARFFSETKKFTMKRICSKLSNNVIFLNEFGVWDSINFTGEIEKAVTRDVKYMSKPMSIDGSVYGFNSISDEVQVAVGMNATDVYTLTSELVSNDYYNWLSKMLNSTALFIYDATGLYRAIKMVNYDYAYNSLNDQSTFSMDYSYTVDNNSISR